MSEKPAVEDENHLIAQRREKLAAWRDAGVAYPNDFRPDSTAAELHARCENLADDALADCEEVAVAGRLMAKRVMGKASFAQLQDRSGRIQLFVQRDAIGVDAYQKFKTLDIGDIVAATGGLMRTKTGELSVRVSSLRPLAKSLRPLPEKWHGLTDTEARYRQRYLDLIMNEESRKVFALRSSVLKIIREYFDGLGYQEVETPMLQAMPGGAAAKPFRTHYNALDHDFYLRIAPELYLKRLVVGGLERVYELNRNFRNEGLSTRHNPEFTMLEFYQAYARHEDLMTLIENLFAHVCAQPAVSDGLAEGLNLAARFARISVEDAVIERNEGLDADNVRDLDALQSAAGSLGIKTQSGWGAGKLLIEIFEKTVETSLMEPTFVVDYPAEVSPLARRKDDDPFVTERFELFVGGREIANGFSELNDPDDQADRFREQVAAKEAGDDEAMYYDEDYVETLEYGMPPTAGAGIGIDRFIMLLTGRQAIRDVVLFPQLRPRKKTGD